MSQLDCFLVGQVYPPAGKENMTTKFQDRNFRECCLKLHANTNVYSQRSNYPLIPLIQFLSTTSSIADLTIYLLVKEGAIKGAI